MKTVLITLSIFFFLSAVCRAQSDLRMTAYAQGKDYYNKNDYLNAYKYLLTYKYLNFDLLNKPAEKDKLANLDNAILYCEVQLKKGLNGSSTWQGHTYTDETPAVRLTVFPKPPLREQIGEEN